MVMVEREVELAAITVTLLLDVNTTNVKLHPSLSRRIVVGSALLHLTHFLILIPLLLHTSFLTR